MNKYFSFFLLPLLASCSTIPTTDEKSIDAAFPTNEIAINTPLPQALDVAETLPVRIEPIAIAAPLSRFNISLHDVEAREFFMGLVIDTDENMLVHPDVTGLISLELKNVTIAQVMDGVQKIYGYDYKKNEMGYIVYPATLQTKIFKINRLDLIRKGRSNTRVSSGQILDQDSATDGNESFRVGGNTANNESNNSAASIPGSWISTEAETDFWAEINFALQTIISIDPQASVVINRHTGIVVVRANPMQLREVRQFIDATQQQISRQVIIEAKIIEIILDDNHQAGINWQTVVRAASKTAPVLTGIGTVGTVLSVGGRWGDFGAAIEILEEQGKTNILSSPRISTLNNQKAIIKVGTDEFFITDVSSNTVTSGSSTISNPEITWTPFFSGIALDVTPQINDLDEITLHIHPSITRVENQIKNFTIDGRDGSLPMALNTVRESDSVIKAKNGQIVVIGGLMQETKKDSKSGIVGLSQIPYLGNLFRVNKGEVSKSELVILLKPTLINNDSDWMSTMGASKEQLKQLQQHSLWK